MDYVDSVYLALKDRQPCKVLMSSLQEPDRFISAVKNLIDSGYLPNVHWDSSYSELTIQEKLPFKFHKNKFQNDQKPTWYDHQNPPLDDPEI